MRLDVPLFTQTSDFSCGSAAVRTQIVEFGNDYHFKTLYQKRYPIRLGKSVFTNGKHN